MIQINLLPGSTKRRASNVPFAAIASGIASQIKDPYLMVMLVAALASAGTVLTLWLGQQSRSQELAVRHAQAAQDSTRYATIVADKRRAEAQRDSLLRQVEVITTIDEDRFVWAHILDEISRYLPQYTWLTALNQTSAAISPAAKRPNADSAKAARDTTKVKTPAEKKAALAAAELARAAESIGKAHNVSFHLVGRTADIQSLTRFMRDMEASPFLKNIVLLRSTALLEDGNAVTEFQVDGQYEAPDPAVTHRVPLTVLAR